MKELINKNSVLLILKIFDAFKISKDLNIKEITNLKVENIAKLSSAITRLSILGKKNEYEEIINNLNNIIRTYNKKEKNYFLNSFIENYYSFYIREGKNKNFSFMLIGLENIFNNYDYNFNKNIFDKIFYVKLEDNYDQIHFLEAAKIANFINEDYYQEIINKNPHLKLLNDNLLYYDIETSNEEIANILSNAIYETNDKVNASNFSNTINNIEKEFKKTPNDIKEIIKLTMDKIVDNKEISPFLIKPLTERLVFNYENFVNGKMFFNKYQYGLSDIKKFYDKLKKEQNKSYLFDLKNKAVLNRKSSKMEELDFSKKETMDYFFNNLFLFSSEYAIKNNIEKNEMKKAKDEYNFFRKNKKIAINLGINVDPELKLDKELEEKIYCYYEQKTIDNHIVEDNKIETEARQINNNELIKDNHNTIDTQNLDKETLDSLSNDNEKLDNLLKEQKNNTLSEGLEAIDDLLIKQQKEEKSIPDKY